MADSTIGQRFFPSDWAREYRQKYGFSVFPLMWRKKTPYKAVKWGEFQKRKPSVDEVNAWWEQFPGSNIGIITGEVSQLVVIDIDSEVAEQLLRKYLPPDCPIPQVQTPRKSGYGKHFYFKYRPGIKSCEVMEGFEIKNDGRYVVAPPSVIKIEKGEGKETDGYYYWTVSLEEAELPEFPEALIQLIQETRPPSKRPPKKMLPDVPDATIPDGVRNTKVFELLWASVVSGEIVTEEALRQRAYQENERCDPPMSDDRVETIINSIERYLSRQQPTKDIAINQDRFMRELQQHTKRHKKPEWLQTNLLTICHQALGGFQHYLSSLVTENQPTLHPSFEFKHAVNYDWHTKTINPTDDISRTLNAITKGIELHGKRPENGGWAYFIPDRIHKKFKQLPSDKQRKWFDRLWNKITAPCTFNFISEMQEEKVSGKVKVVFRPLVVNWGFREDGKDRETFYPIIIETVFYRQPYNAWTQKTRNAFWKELLNLDIFKISPMPEGAYLPALSKSRALVRIPELFARETLGDGQLDLFDSLNESLRQAAIRQEITTTGLDLTIGERQSTQAAYEMMGKHVQDGSLDLSDPRKYGTPDCFIDFSIPKYLEAYGHEKKLLGRGRYEWRPKPRTKALENLKSLFMKRFISTYFVTDPKTEKRIKGVGQICDLGTLIWNIESPNNQEAELLKQGEIPQRGHIRLIPSRFMLTEYGSKYLLSRATFVRDLLSLNPKASDSLARFIDWIDLTVTWLAKAKLPLKQQIGMRKLANTIRLNLKRYERDRKLKELEDTIKDYCDTAKTLGYIKKYSVRQGAVDRIFHIRFNPGNFGHLKLLSSESSIPTPSLKQPRGESEA